MTTTRVRTFVHPMSIARAFAVRFITSSSHSAFAKAKEKKDGKANDAAPGVADAKVARGLNYMKKGDDPAIGSDDAYPQWLHDVLTPRENLGEYERRAAKAKAEGKDWRETFTADDAKRYTKLMRVAKMKANNAERAKK